MDKFFKGEKVEKMLVPQDLCKIWFSFFFCLFFYYMLLNLKSLTLCVVGALELLINKHSSKQNEITWICWVAVNIDHGETMM